MYMSGTVWNGQAWQLHEMEFSNAHKAGVPEKDILTDEI